MLPTLLNFVEELLFDLREVDYATLEMFIKKCLPISVCARARKRFRLMFVEPALHQFVYYVFSIMTLASGGMKKSQQQRKDTKDLGRPENDVGPCPGTRRNYEIQTAVTTDL